jgi:hypothetical protein
MSDRDLSDFARSEFLVSLSLGVAAEQTGVAVAERMGGERGRYRITWLDRLSRAGVVPFLQRAVHQLEQRDVERRVVERRATLAAVGVEGLGIPRLTLSPITVLCDITGAGEAGLAPLRPAGFSVEAIVLHGGTDAGWDKAGRCWRIPKTAILSELYVAFSEQRVLLPETLPEAAALRAELVAFRPTVRLARDPGLASDLWRERPGDDLLLALGTAVWWAETHGYPEFPAAMAALFDAPLLPRGR